MTSATRSLTVTAEHVAQFTKITGDYNPLHFDEDFASRTKFGRLVAQGGITTGLLHAVTQLAVRIERQKGEVVLEGEAWCYTTQGNPR